MYKVCFNRINNRLCIDRPTQPLYNNHENCYYLSHESDSRQLNWLTSSLGKSKMELGTLANKQNMS